MIPVEVKRLEDILVSFLGQPKSEMTESFQLQFPCPRCIENKGEQEKYKHNLEVNLAKGVFKCWSCAAEGEDMQGSIKKLIKKYGNASILRDYEEAIQDIMNSQLYELKIFQNEFKESVIESLHLPKTYTEIPDLEHCKDWKVKKYLKGRGFNQDMINRFHIGYTTWDEESFADKQRIIIPSYNSFGELNYWVGRDFSGYDKKTKYKNCKANKDEIIFQESLINFDAPIILVEGAIDCLYYPNTISLLGKVLTNECEIYRQLIKKANSNIYICLDGDTDIKETKRIYNLLNKGKLKDKIYYIRLGEEGEVKYKDFGEIYENESYKGIIKAVRSAKQFSEIDLMI